MRMLALVAILGLTAASTAIAAEMSFEEYWNQATHSPGIVTKQYPKVTVITDKKNLTVYIFTKPNNPAHPGVIVRKLVNEKNGAYFDTEGHSYGPDSAQAAFKAWMDNPLN